jgi:type I restriction enzyme S subunit
MSLDWPSKKLVDIADICVSNVDKKSRPTEIPVKLCNYMDVYSNQYVTDLIDFMEASASKAEIERFSLRQGDVVITKDSETPDDIGIPAVIADEIDSLVCGYHLALIRPHGAELDPVYLAKQLSTSRVTRYFAVHAGGSTRYGLPISVIESVCIPTPPKPEQTKIAEILSTVDRAIEQTEGLITKQRLIKAGLMQDLLTSGIDEHGNLRSEATHKFKDSPLGRIPVEWDVELLDRCVRNDSPICYGILMPGPGHDNGVPVIKVRDIVGGKIRQNDLLLTDPKIDNQYKRSRLCEGDVLITIRGTTGRIAVVPPELDGANITQDTARVRLKEEHSHYYFYFLLQSKGVQDQVSLHTVGQAVKGINIGDVKNISFGLPKKYEQLTIAARLQDIQTNLDNTGCQLGKLRRLKTALMQDLLTGKRRVTCLLGSEPKREKMHATS